MVINFFVIVSYHECGHTLPCLVLTQRVTS